MQTISRLTATPPPPAHGRPAPRPGLLQCRGRPPGAATNPRARQRGGAGKTAEPARKPGAGKQPEEGELAEELEALEEKAIGGNDEGRRPTDYDRRAHIFEESSRVFRAIKERGGDGGGGGDGASAADTSHAQS